MFCLTREIIRNGNGSSHGLPTNMEKLCQDLGILEMCDMKDIGNNSFLKTNLLGIKANYFAGGTTVSDHLIERK